MTGACGQGRRKLCLRGRSQAFRQKSVDLRNLLREHRVARGGLERELRSLKEEMTRKDSALVEMEGEEVPGDLPIVSLERHSWRELSRWWDGHGPELRLHRQLSFRAHRHARIAYCCIGIEYQGTATREPV